MTGNMGAKNIPSLHTAKHTGLQITLVLTAAGCMQCKVGAHGKNQLKAIPCSHFVLYYPLQLPSSSLARCMGTKYAFNKNEQCTYRKQSGQNGRPHKQYFHNHFAHTAAPPPPPPHPLKATPTGIKVPVNKVAGVCSSLHSNLTAPSPQRLTDLILTCHQPHMVISGRPDSVKSKNARAHVLHVCSTSYRVCSCKY